MARRVEVQLIDDLDGRSPADERVVFGLDGCGYEIDLTAANAAALRARLDPWIAVARQRDRSRHRSNVIVHHRPALQPDEASQVRAWARAAGVQIAPRGKIPFDVIRAYRHAQQ